MAKQYDNDGMRLTDCCSAASTYVDKTLCCKACYKEVSRGEGDGTENRQNAESADSRV